VFLEEAFMVAVAVDDFPDQFGSKWDTVEAFFYGFKLSGHNSKLFFDEPILSNHEITLLADGLALCVCWTAGLALSGDFVLVGSGAFR
jgi:hypothetical protein